MLQPGNQDFYILCYCKVILFTRSTQATVVCIVITYSTSMDQPGEVANPARGQLNRKNESSPVPVRA